jgi:hypothetical protein
VIRIRRFNKRVDFNELNATMIEVCFKRIEIRSLGKVHVYHGV